MLSMLLTTCLVRIMTWTYTKLFLLSIACWHYHVLMGLDISEHLTSCTYSVLIAVVNAQIHVKQHLVIHHKLCWLFMRVWEHVTLQVWCQMSQSKGQQQRQTWSAWQPRWSMSSWLSGGIHQTEQHPRRCSPVARPAESHQTNKDGTRHQDTGSLQLRIKDMHKYQQQEAWLWNGLHRY